MKFKFFSILALAGLLLGSCAVDELPSEGGSIVAEMETDQTRTAVTDEGTFTWSAGDKVWLHTTAGSVVGTLSDGAGSSSAKFTYGGFVGEMTGKAVYPYNDGHSISGEVLNFVLPASYDLGSSLTNTNAAMYGVTVDGTLKFNHLAGVMRFSFKDVPAGTDKFIITLDKKINGTFTADLGDEYPLIETSAATVDPEKSITLNFDPLASTSDIKLYVPLPVGTYGSLGLALYAGEKSVWTYSNTVSNKIGRKTLKLMPVVTIGGSIGGDIDNDGENPDTGVLLELLAELEDREAKIADHLSSLAIDLEQTQLLREVKIDARSEKEEELADLNQTLEQVQQARLPLVEGLEDIKLCLWLLEPYLASAEKEMDDLEYYLQELSGDVEYYKENFEDSEGKVQKWEAMIEAMYADMLSCEDRIWELSGDEDYLTDWYCEMSDALQVEQLNVSVCGSGTETDEKKNKSQTIDEKIYELHRILYSIYRCIDEAEQYVVEVYGQLETLTQDLYDWKAAQQEAVSNIVIVETEIQELDSEIETLGEDIKKIQSEYSALQEVYESLQKVIPDYKAEIIAINESIDGIRTDDDRETVKQNIKTLRSTMTAKLNEVDNVLSNI